jgi:hypothetical protein
MNVWAENPEWFDEWVEQRALEGKFGAEIKRGVENGTIVGSELWSRAGFDPKGDFGSQALQDFYERYVE